MAPAVPRRNLLSVDTQPPDAVPPRTRRRVLAIVWLPALAAVLLIRFRTRWPAYTALHKSLADRGVPEWVRNLDSVLVLVAASLLGAWLAHRALAPARASTAHAAGDRPATTPAMLGLRRGERGWPRVVLVALAPMVVGGLVLGVRNGNIPAPASTVVPAVWSGVVRAAVQEELFFRGLLVAVPAAAIGWAGRAFWVNASFAAALFGAMHIRWTLEGLSGGWGTLLMTFAGGLWFAWLLARWRTLWVPMILHAGMNLGWMLAAAEGGAGGGGLIENLLRAATIALATWLTIRRTAGPTGEHDAA